MNIDWLRLTVWTSAVMFGLAFWASVAWVAWRFM